MKYDHYIGVDWSQTNMAIARITKGESEIKVTDVKSNIEELKFYLKQLKGKKTLTIEESNASQWLYTELRELVDNLIICDPYRNRLLSEGAKTDKIDAKKLVILLKNDLLKPVFHNYHELMGIRKLLSGYEDLIKMGVRMKNQRSAMMRSQGRKKSSKEIEGKYEQIVLSQLDRGISVYEREKKFYEKAFVQVCKKYATIKKLTEVPGIGVIGAVKYAGIIVDPQRFKNKGHYLSYCGLIRLAKESGGKNYGYRKPRYSRALKGVLKIAAVVILNSDKESNPIKNYYNYLLKEKRYPEHKARQAVARKVAIILWAMLKNKERFDSKKVFLGL